MNIYAMIMAGGGGTRFWPLSRQNMPKQLLNLSGEDAMINETIKRCSFVMPIENIFIVTNETQAEIMSGILIKEFLRENILIEPAARNTAPCILYAAMHILEKHGDGILCVFPADHYITNQQGFIDVLNQAVQIAGESNRIVTIGIKPSFPSTGYGYIKRKNNTKWHNAFELDRFVEKPNAEIAREYVNSGDYYWNSGMFIWKVSLIIELFERFLPKLYKEFKKISGEFTSPNIAQLIHDVYSNIDGISVDYGIMERIDEAFIILGDFGWNDVGSWDALGAVYSADESGNIVKAKHIGNNTKECIIYGSDRLIATVGIYNTVIVETDDAILVCAKDKAQDVKYIVDKLKELGRIDLL